MSLGIPVVDLHEDVSTYFIFHGAGQSMGDFAEDLPGRDADIPKYLRGGVKLVFASIPPCTEMFDLDTSKRLRELYGVWVPAVRFRIPQVRLLDHLIVYYRLAETYQQIEIVEKLEQVRGILRAQGKVGFLIHIEGAEAIDEPYDLYALKRLGVRAVGLTWNYCNKYGCGALARKDYGLTDAGEELVRTANRLGIIIDVAHASKRTALEAIEASRKPVMVSHTNIRKLVDTPRNADDEVLEAVARNKGVVGLSILSPLVATGRRATLDDLLKHFMYVYQSYGADILAIGTDFHGRLGIPPVQGFETIDRVGELLRKLGEMGLGDSDLRKIAYENAVRVIEANFAE